MPITALIFGGRRREVAPLVYEARNWQHGVLVGASVASETTAAAVGQAGVVRRDPMAMLPFCGYNFADYWRHWLDVGAKLTRAPKIYHVNWFRRDAQGSSSGPASAKICACSRGCWIAARRGGRHRDADRIAAAAGRPQHEGLDVSNQSLARSSVDPALWRKEVAEIREYLAQYGARLPPALREELAVTESLLG